MRPQSSVSYVGWLQSFFHAKHFGSVLALSFSLMLAACGGGGSTVTENNLPEAGLDGIAPTLTSVSILQQQEKNASADGVAKLGQSIKVDFTASEALMLPVVTINGVAATLQGKIGDWSASREMVESDVDGYATFSISFSDTSGEVGVDVTESTDDSRVQYCAEGCVAPVEDPLAGEWMLDGEGAAGVGPTAGSMEWWSSTAANGAGPAERACWFDDIFSMSKDGTFKNVQGDETWIESWQGGADACGAPVAPHDGSASATYLWNEAAGTLTITGKGAHLGLAKAVNGQELASSGSAPESITYQILTLTADGMSLTVTVETAAGVWWTFNLAKKPISPFVGNWKLDGEGAAGVGPTAGSMEWWSSTAANGAGPAERACWFDDVFAFGLDNSFSNLQGGSTWVEAWQGGVDACGAPVAPHDGSATASFVHDEVAGTLTISGKGAHLGLAKAVNGQELASSASAPDSITYNILTLTADGMNLTVTVETASGVWWTFNLAKVPVSPIAGNWRLDGEGAAGVGPTSGSMEWWSSTSANGAGPAERACWFDDRFTFGEDGSFRNVLGNETWIEAWQGGSDACGAPVAPHDGSATATFSYDEASATLTLTGKGAHLGLAKAVNGQELGSSASAPDYITYNVLTLTADGNNMTVTVETAAGVWWTFVLVKVPESALVGSWSLDGEGAAGVGPTEGSMEWWSSTSANGAGPAERACWFDDTFEFGDDGSFSNILGTETWVEAWQGGADSCATPVAPHDGSVAATYSSDETAGTLTISGKGAHIGLAKAVNGSELTSSESAPESITYNVLTATADGNFLTLSVETGAGVWWTFNLAKNASVVVDPVVIVDPVDPVDPVVVESGELVTNGGFQDGITGWSSGAAVAANITSYFAVAETTSGNVYDVNLSQIMAIVPESVYTITFKAKSSIERTIIAGVGLNSGDYANSAESVSLTTEWQTFTLSQTSTGFGDDSSRVLFDMGGDQGGQVWLDDVSVTTADGTELVTNGSFDAAATADQVFGLAGWSSGAAVAANITSYFAVAETTSGNVYDVNLSQIMAIVPDTDYTITFKAKSSIERTIIAGVGLNSGDYANSAESVSLTTEWQTFTLSQTSTGFGDDSSRVLFDMGGDQGGQVWLDDVSVK